MNGLTLLSVLEDKQVKIMAKDLRDKINALIIEEKKFCHDNHVPRQMTPEKYHKLDLLIDKCMTPWHITALERMVTQQYLFPTFDEVDAYAHDLMTEAFHV